MSEPGRRVKSAAMPAKAMLLAAGVGSRLRPLTDSVPKCMLPIAGAPLLEHTVRWLARSGIESLVINLHYLPHVIEEHFGDGSRFGIQITYSREQELLGTAGAIKRVSNLFENAPFFVWYGDNLSRCDLAKMARLHAEAQANATIALHHREDPTASGIVGLDNDDRITRFLEKPKREEIFSHWVNAGILLVEPEVLDYIPASGPYDFGRQVFPALLAAGKRLQGYRLSDEEGLWWIDTAQDYNRLLSSVERGAVKPK